MTYTLHTHELDRPDVQDLLALHVSAMHAHSPPEACHVLPGSALAHPSITFFSLREDGRLLGIGALKALGGGEGEIKSMRTAPDALGRGVGKAMLAAISGEARDRGYVRLLLETGRTDDFAAANALYDRAGFTECGPFGDYPGSPFTRFLRVDL
ncbi:GNAT family N-acetyltransferase [Sphingomonas sp. LHG3406-1]|uniref:GNAT family N-acetyltransferase n=1 Tax=Sphingomonas sp. LHG3406-1 TaxID=2804617 RepID=UPI00262B6625|nr:GNAT family N-acetyltransferase [Sphingomonas sp. LHG3406-1]